MGSKQNGRREACRWRIRFGRLLLSRGLDPGGEAGLVAGSSVLVDDALFNALVDERNRLAVDGLALGLIAGGDSRSELAELGAQPGRVRAVYRRLRFRLPGALQRRVMIRHNC